MPIAHIGDWCTTEMKLVDTVINSQFVEKLHVLDTRNLLKYYTKHNASSAYIISPDNCVVVQLKTSRYNLGMNLYAVQTNMVVTSELYRDHEITKHLYTLLCKHYGTLVCDRDQYDGARALWKSLGKSGFHNYVYDEVMDTLTSVKDFNNEKFIWSFNNASKEHILMVISTKELKTSPQY